MADPVPPNLPEVSAVTAFYSFAGHTAVNRWHVLSSGLPALEVFNRFSTAWTATLMGHTVVGVRLDRLRIMRLDNQSATEEFSTVGTEWDGSASGEAIIQGCLLLKYTTGFRGLASTGRTYAPFIAELLNVNGAIDPAAKPSLEAAWVSFVNTLSSQTIPLQVVSYGRFNHPRLPDAPAANHTVTGVSLNARVATQRNRQSRTFN